METSPADSKPSHPTSGKAIAAFVLGVLGLLMWLIPLLGLPVNLVGLVFAIQSTRSSKSGLAIAGLTMCIIGLVLTIANGAIGAYLGATGQLKFQ
jgi:hypothetical protein